MPREVRRHPDFEADFLKQLRWIVERGERGWVLMLHEGLEQAMTMLSAFPAAGPRIGEDGSVVLRKLIFAIGPYVAWYLYDEADPEGDLWMVRLFHAHQKRPMPKAQRWSRMRR